MGILSAIKQAIDEASARERAEKKALYERVKPYNRGYDVYPDEVTDHFAGMLKKKLVKQLITELLLLALAAGGITAGFVWGYVPPIVILPIPALVLLALVIQSFSRLNRISERKFDAYGAMVTDSRVDTRTSTDSEGNTTTTYDYYLWLNGIKCEVTSKEFNKAPVGVYTYFVRLKGKYIKQDLFFLYPTDPSEADHRIGQHYPDEELRLWAPPAPNGLATMLCILGFMAGIGGFLAYALPRTGDRLWLMTAIGGGVMVIVGFIARAVSRKKRAQDKLVQKVKQISKKKQNNM